MRVRVAQDLAPTCTPSFLALGCRSHRLTLWRCVPRPEAQPSRALDLLVKSPLPGPLVLGREQACWPPTSFCHLGVPTSTCISPGALNEEICCFLQPEWVRTSVDSNNRRSWAPVNGEWGGGQGRKVRSQSLGTQPVSRSRPPAWGLHTTMSSRRSPRWR